MTQSYVRYWERIRRREAAGRVEQIVNEIYDKLEEIEDILKEVAPEEFGAEEAYWISHIDEALLNLLEDVSGILKEEEEEEE